MVVPKARKLPSGVWFIQLRLGGESIPVTANSERTCIKEARAIKAEYLAGKLEVKGKAPERETVTLTAAIDRYISVRSNKLSPLTIRGYRIIQKNRFQKTMQRRLDQIADNEWEGIVNDEAALCSAKTLKNAYAFVRGVVHEATGRDLPDVTMPGAVSTDRAFLDPDQILVFVDAVKDTRYAVPALLALSSMRISEIQALRWENIPKSPKFIKVSGSVVFDEHNHYRHKQQNKNITSARNVPVMIPELAVAIERDRKSHGPVLDITQNSLRIAVKKICAQNDLPPVTIHGLRHSFASLAYHLQIPEKIAMEIGGWADPGTMHKIYTHIARSDISRYQTAMTDFYSAKETTENANKNANEK